MDFEGEIQKAILSAMQGEIDGIKTRLIKEFVAKFEREISDLVFKYAIDISNRVKFETMGNEVVFTIQKNFNSGR